MSTDNVKASGGSLHRLYQIKRLNNNAISVNNVGSAPPCPTCEKPTRIHPDICSYCVWNICRTDTWRYNV